MERLDGALGEALSAALTQAIAASQAYLLSIQEPQGYWWAELESNVSITAEVVLLHKIWDSDRTRPLHKVEKYLRSQQRQHGGWELHFGDGGELSVSVEAYMALRLLGVSATDPALLRAKTFIRDRGGIDQTRIFTKFHLALIGCYDWSGLPSIPPWIMLLPAWKLELPSLWGGEPWVFGHSFSIYEMSSWARGSTVPLLIVFDQKPIYPQGLALEELYVDSHPNKGSDLPVQVDLPRDPEGLFQLLDRGFKFAEAVNWVPWRQEGLKAAEQWILARQEATGDWGGIIPAMLNSLLALRSLGYDRADPVVERGLRAIDRFAIATTDEYRVQPCISPVWDTALVMRSLVDSGLAADDPALTRAGQWLLDKQILSPGDWAVKRPQAAPGGWAFEFENCFYPDVDDTAVVVMALQAIQLPEEAPKQQAIARAVDWIAAMQCRPGGWAAFDVDNDQEWLNAMPYADLKAMVDPNTADVTARVLEMWARSQPADRKSGSGLSPDRVERALAYLRQTQEADGSWFGRWGVNYLYGTSGVLTALALLAPQDHQDCLRRGVNWLVQCQNPDGGWGETCESYKNPALKGQGDSTASQTAWAMIGLLAAGEGLSDYAELSLDRGVAYLVQQQRSDGTWQEDAFTGTGFPGHFYLKYHLYQQHFPLTALGRYRRYAMKLDRI